MVFKIFTPRPVLNGLGSPGMGSPVIDTNTLRQAALQNSWQRDQRVARRRLAMRWVLWWLWKCRYVLLALCAVLAYLFYRFNLAEQPTASVKAPVEAAEKAAPSPQSDVHLRIQPQLLEPSQSSAKADPLPADTQPMFQLKPETQLKIKETNP
jgi:hypothetical protein